tara:strand:- start:7610 stop:7777 length:168 start_codon:yes stop_codon:yes gene_type:complete
MNFIQKWLYLRREDKKDRERARDNSWLEEYSKEMIDILDRNKQDYKGNPNWSSDD